MQAFRYLFVRVNKHNATERQLTLNNVVKLHILHTTIRQKLIIPNHHLANMA